MGQQVSLRWKQTKKKWKKLMFRKRVQSQSNEPMVTKDQGLHSLLWSFSLFHRKDFWDEIFCNMLLKIHIIFQYITFFVLSFHE